MVVTGVDIGREVEQPDEEQQQYRESDDKVEQFDDFEEEKLHELSFKSMLGCPE